MIPPCFAERVEAFIRYCDKTEPLINAYNDAVYKKDVSGAMECVSGSIKVTRKNKDGPKEADRQELKEALDFICQRFESVVYQGEREFFFSKDVVIVKFMHCLKIDENVYLTSKVKQKWTAEEIDNKMLLTSLKVKEKMKFTKEPQQVA